MDSCQKCRVSGKVQGVWFRGSTREKALGLGITGYAHNLADGTVEVLACGDADAVQQLKDWLWQGPQLAQVTDVSCQVVELPSPPKGFNIA
ncbi:MAG: acylphosphatase [Gammaproteobacteria bacterium]|nr:acylphosphatase [Gammaproteobacteria bacterium]MDH5801115.1 acylphosphatase [Gammaproteobacteria bacterium]